MAICHRPNPEGAVLASDVLHQLRQRNRHHPGLAEALRCIETTEQTAELIHQHDLVVTPEPFWRHRGP